MIKTRMGAVLLAAMILMTGCRGTERQLFLKASGHYDGFAVARDGHGNGQILVAADVKLAEADQLALVVKPAVPSASEPGRQWDFTLTVRSSHKLFLTSAQLLPQEIELRHDEDDCFSAKPAGAVKDLRLCFDGRELSIDLALAGDTDFALTVNRYLEGEQPTLEPAAPYTVAQLRALAEKQGFSSRLEFQRVTESRAQALNAHLNLYTPHVTVGDVLGLITFSWQNLLRMVGDLAPFALINRWYRAHETQEQYLAEKDSLVVMKADSANIAEGLALGILRDEEARHRLAAYAAPLAELRDRMLAREQLGSLPHGTSDDLSSVEADVEKSVLGLDQAIAEEYMAVAQAVGFVNPKAVAAITASDIGELDHPVAIDTASTGTLAIERSVELSQMDHLIEAARAEHTARIFDWMDPSGAGLGVGIAPYIGVSSHLVDELRIRRDQTESILLQKVGMVGQELDSSVKLFDLSTRNLDIQQRRVQRIMDQLQLGIPVSFADLQTAFSAQMKADLDQVNAKFEYGVALTKLNRVLFAGPYLELRPSVRQ